MNKSADNITKYAKLFVKLAASRIAALFYRKQELWLISERGNEARDNASVFFLWLKKNHPEIACYYVITKYSNDYQRMACYSDSLVAYRSWKHYVMVWRASKLISTHVMGSTPDGSRYLSLNQRFRLLKGKKIVFLQHGIIKENIPFLFGNFARMDLFVCGAKLEYEYVKKYFNHPDGVVRYTGLCRYDNLNHYECKNQILIMPTWRRYIDKSNFEASDYYRQFARLLTDPRLSALAEKHGMDVVFYPHYEVQSNIQSFKKLALSPRITIASFEHDVQTLLKESRLLITDYSSVYFDMAYMRKPIIFFQFDTEVYYNNHYFRGYLDDNQLGAVVSSVDGVMEALSQTLLSGCTMQPEHRAFADSMFALRDSNNCQRVFDAIASLR